MTIFWYIISFVAIFLAGMVGGAVIAVLDGRDAERQRRQEPVRVWNFKL